MFSSTLASLLKTPALLIAVLLLPRRASNDAVFGDERSLPQAGNGGRADGDAHPGAVRPHGQDGSRAARYLGRVRPVLSLRPFTSATVVGVGETFRPVAFRLFCLLRACIRSCVLCPVFCVHWWVWRGEVMGRELR